MRLYKLKNIREKSGKTQEQAAHELDVPLSSYQGWEQLKNNPELPRVVTLADFFNCKIDDLLGRTLPEGAILPIPSDTFAPVAGYVHGGDATEAIEITDEYLWVHPDIQAKHPNGFFLKVIGRSMNKILPEYSYAYISPESEVQSGDVGVIKVNGDDATIKRIFFAGDSIVLHPESTDDEFRDRMIDSKSPDAPEVRIVGRMVWHTMPVDFEY
jgi:repressor LexA